MEQLITLCKTVRQRRYTLKLWHMVRQLPDAAAALTVTPAHQVTSGFSCNPHYHPHFESRLFRGLLRSTVKEREREEPAPPELATTMLGLNEPLLINILGHAAGALIFAIFLVLLYSGRGWSGMQGRYLSGLAAGLSLAWNLGSLVVLAWPDLPAPAPVPGGGDQFLRAQPAARRPAAGVAGGRVAGAGGARATR